MEVKSLSSMLLLVIVAAVAVAAGIFYYNRYIEPQNDGPMERAGEKIDKVLEGK